MTYTFFFTLTFYSFYRGFIEKQDAFKMLCIFSMAATMLASEAGAMIGPVFALLLVLYSKKEWLRDKVALTGILVWSVLAYFVFFYKVPGTFHPFTVHLGLRQINYFSLALGLRENIINITYPWRALDASFPFSMPFFLAMAFLVAQRKQLKQFFPLLAIVPALIILSLLTYRVQYRILVAVLPLYYLAVTQLLSLFYRNFNNIPQQSVYPSQNVQHHRLKPQYLSIIVFIVIFLGIILTKHIDSPKKLKDYYQQAFGYNDMRARVNPESTFKYLKTQVNQNDIIILTTLEYGYFFLGNDYNYYYLRQKKTVNNAKRLVYSTFSEPKDPYYAKTIIDSADKLRQISNIDKRIFCILGPKSIHVISPELQSVITNTFKLERDDNYINQTRIYFNQCD
jgi:hypothetical protein